MDRQDWERAALAFAAAAAVVLGAYAGVMFANWVWTNYLAGGAGPWQ